MRLFYVVYVIDLENEEVEDCHYVFAGNAEQAKLKGLALSVEAETVKADEVDKYHVHACNICELPEYYYKGGDAD